MRKGCLKMTPKQLSLLNRFCGRVSGQPFRMMAVMSNTYHLIKKVEF